MLLEFPCVYAVGCEYQIVIHTREHGIAWIEIGENKYYHADNGILHSETTVHKITVPGAELNRAGEYRVCFQSLPERKAYFPVLGAVEQEEYRFFPIDSAKDLTIFHMADIHSKVDAALSLASHMGTQPDLLILNGDIPAESKSQEDLMAVSQLGARITKGEHPIIFVRGNHDFRGKYAIDLLRYVGTDQGHTYFTFRAGPIWGIVLDCGEDKEDNCSEYGGLIKCHEFRRQQTTFLNQILEKHAEEFNAPGVTLRLALCHVPFTTAHIACDGAEFDIEHDIYYDWTKRLNKMGIDVMLCGHVHKPYLVFPDDEQMRYMANFPVLIASELRRKSSGMETDYLAGARIKLSNNNLTADIVDTEGGIRNMLTLPLNHI